MSNCDFMFSKAAITRFSHDLAGVIGAVSSSLSLLSELGGADKETLDLAVNNADILMGRLRFFRAAFGNEGPLSNISVTQKLLEDYLSTLENQVVHFDCAWQTDQELPIFFFRLILLVGQIAAESLTRGGRIDITARAGEKQISVKAKGKTISWNPDEHNLLTDENVSPKNIPIFFLKKCLTEKNWQMSVSFESESLIFLLSENH